MEREFNFYPFSPKIVEETYNHGIIEIEGLYPGYGITIANTLRRVLLSSIAGGAVTALKIEGVPHEFTTIPGILENTIKIILNFKKIRCRVFSDEPIIGKLKIKGKKKIIAGDIQTPTEVEIINKDLYLFSTTDKNKETEIEIMFEKGFGYVPSEVMKKTKLPIGSILVDAWFSPVKKVSYKVINMRIKERADFNKIILEIETDGTIKPSEAFLKAAAILKEHYIILSGEKERKFVKEPETATISKYDMEEILNSEITILNLTTKTLNAIKKAKIKTIKKLIKKKSSELLKIPRFGKKALIEVNNALSKFNLSIKE